MQWQKVTAIIRRQALQPVEQRLREMGVKGVTVTSVRGYGEYANLFHRSWMVPHLRLEIFTDTGRARIIAEAILSAAHTGAEGDGLVAILPVDEIYRVRECRPCRRGEI